MKNNLLEMFLSWLFILVFVILISSAAQKYTKQDVADHFAISRKTLGKWIELLPNSIPPKKWSFMRKITGMDFSSLKSRWDYEGFKTMNKKQLVAFCESTYEDLAENVKMNLEKIGITEEAWRSLSACSLSTNCNSNGIITFNLI